MRTNNKQGYRISTVKDAKKIASDFIRSIDLDKVISFGLPEIDDRFDIWRVPLLSLDNTKIGEVVIDAIS